MGLAAYGLREWKSAVDRFQNVRNEFPSNKDVQAELIKAKQRLLESQTGKYNWKAMYLDNKNGVRELDVADYTGPIEIADIPGKGKSQFYTCNISFLGKGIVVKEDIKKGTLLL